MLLKLSSAKWQPLCSDLNLEIITLALPQTSRINDQIRQPWIKSHLQSYVWVYTLQVNLISVNIIYSSNYSLSCVSRWSSGQRIIVVMLNLFGQIWNIFFISFLNTEMAYRYSKLVIERFPCSCKHPDLNLHFQLILHINLKKKLTKD